MSTMLTLDEIRRQGMKALVRELGPVGAIRFLQQYETGSGNYSEERHGWLGNPDLTTLVERIRAEARPDDASSA